MTSRRTFTVFVPSMLLAVSGLMAWTCGITMPPIARAQLGGQPASSPATAAQRSTAGTPGAALSNGRVLTEAENAIRAADDAFVREYNQGDSKALAAHFTEDAEAIESDGERYQGRELIERRLAETLAASPGVKMTLEIESIRFLSPDVAKEEGRTRVTPTREAPLVRPFTVLYVKRDNRWLISSVREDPELRQNAHVHLQELDWMIGEWIDEGHDSVVRARCRWSEDGNFLLRHFTVKRQGQPVMTVTQRIGWDPLAGQIRSWEFDSEGGFGEGKWSRDGERWTVKHTGVRPDGTPASAVNNMVRERPDLVRWASTARVLGDESVPDEESYVLVRFPPAPDASSKSELPSAQAPNTKRSPQ
jgi:uncharacterized protein (TIGR02246 family)